MKIIRKRISCIVLSALLVLSAFALTSCDADTYKTLQNATAKTASLDSYEAQMTLSVEASVAGNSFSIPVKYDIKAAGLTTDSPVFSAETSLDIGLGSVGATIYKEADYIYLQTEGILLDTKTKMKCDSEEAEDYDIASLEDMFEADLPEEVLESVELIKNEDGSKTVSLALSSEQFKQYYGKLVDDVASDVADEAEISSLTVSDIKVEIHINSDGYISKYLISFGMTETVKFLDETVDASVKVTAEFEYKDPGKTVTVVPPEGYQDFTDIGAAA